MMDDVVADPFPRRCGLQEAKLEAAHFSVLCIGANHVDKLQFLVNRSFFSPCFIPNYVIITRFDL